MESRRQQRVALGRSRSAVRHRNDRGVAPPLPTTSSIRRDFREPAKRLEITLAVVGSVKVGKSAMVSQFLWQGFIADYRPTVEEFNWIEYDLEQGRALMLQIIDSSGSRDFLAMRNLYIRTADAFLVVFAVDDAQSFEEARKIIEDILEHRGRTVPIVLVANKRDVIEDNRDWRAKGSYAFARANAIPMVECCAKRQAEVATAFQELLERLREQRNIMVGDLKKRRQSMPSTRAYSGIDLADIEKLKDKQKPSCIVS
ncbi:unnamed protein product [Caenorhabditis auriculariae]|uniref:Uncharacterized protein n=1 Tax=Caenorhabditis auriculariae TaxID=2777116 RepID=A0A8S1GN12_9PELO|nr:unnamed protein product [Caenorhabditis auriculariae]